MSGNFGNLLLGFGGTFEPVVEPLPPEPPPAITSHSNSVGAEGKTLAPKPKTRFPKLPLI